MVAGNPIIGRYSIPQPEFAEESLEISGTRIRAQVTAAAALVDKSVNVLYPSERQEDSAVWSGSDWEQISLAVHRLPTSGVYYRLGKRLLDVVTVCAFPTLPGTPALDRCSHCAAELSWTASVPSEAHRQIWT